MIRLLIWGTLFGLGVWSGMEIERVRALDRCLAAGGSVGPGGVCSGAA